jgi:hypothetical protein
MDSFRFHDVHDVAAAPPPHPAAHFLSSITAPSDMLLFLSNNTICTLVSLVFVIGTKSRIPGGGGGRARRRLAGRPAVGRAPGRPEAAGGRPPAVSPPDCAAMPKKKKKEEEGEDDDKTTTTRPRPRDMTAADAAVAGRARVRPAPCPPPPRRGRPSIRRRRRACSGALIRSLEPRPPNPEPQFCACLRKGGCMKIRSSYGVPSRHGMHFPPFLPPPTLPPSSRE